MVFLVVQHGQEANALSFLELYQRLCSQVSHFTTLSTCLLHSRCYGCGQSLLQYRHSLLSCLLSLIGSASGDGFLPVSAPCQLFSKTLATSTTFPPPLAILLHPLSAARCSRAVLRGGALWPCSLPPQPHACPHPCCHLQLVRLQWTGQQHRQLQ